MFTFDEYQSRTATTALYHDAIARLSDQSPSSIDKLLCLAYVGLGLGEVGELQGKIKKIIRDKRGIVDNETRDKIAKELGDVLWYVSQLCSELELDMGEVAKQNLDKLADRKERGVLVGEGDDR